MKAKPSGEYSESQLPLALAALGVAFAEALIQAQPSLQGPLKKAVLKWAHEMRDRGAGWELPAAGLSALSRALHDPTLFPKVTSKGGKA